MCDEFLLERCFSSSFGVEWSVCVRGVRGRFERENIRAFFVVVPFILPNAGHRGALLAQWPSKGRVWQ